MSGYAFYIRLFLVILLFLHIPLYFSFIFSLDDNLFVFEIKIKKSTTMGY